MNVLLTGATGFLGKYILAELLDRGHAVTVFGRRPPEQDVSWIQGDCGELHDCIAAMQGRGFDAVLHVAALPRPTDTPGTPEYEDLTRAPVCMATNVMGLYNMLSAAQRTGVGIFIQTGSNCVMGHERRISELPPPWQYLPIDEVHPGDPQDSYSVSKACGEILLKSFGAYGMRTYALRCGWILDRERRVMVASKRAARPTEDIRQVFNSYIAAEDCAAAHILLLEAAGAGRLLNHDVFYLNADDTLAPEPTMELLERFRPDLIPLLRRPLPGWASFFSNERLKQAAGWAPKLSWRDEIRENL